MNARVFLLVLVTAAFMAVWDADRPSSVQTVLAHSKPQDAAAPDRLPSIATAKSHAHQARVAGSDSTSARADSDALILLSKDLQPGTWLATDPDGNTVRITIEHSRSLSGSWSTETQLLEHPEKKLCVITGPDATPWRLIQEHPSLSASTNESR